MKTRTLTATHLLTLIMLTAVSAAAQDWDRAVSLFNQKQYRPAIREFHAVLKANPDAWQSWYYIGASHFSLQSYLDSIDAFQNYIKVAEKDEKAQVTGNYFIGMSHYQLKQYDKAIPAFARYIALSDKTQQKVDTTARAALGAVLHLCQSIQRSDSGADNRSRGNENQRNELLLPGLRAE